MPSERAAGRRTLLFFNSKCVSRLSVNAWAFQAHEKSAAGSWLQRWVGWSRRAVT